MTLEWLFAFLAVFLGVKAVEHRGEGAHPLYLICSLGAWICAGVTVVLANVPV